MSLSAEIKLEGSEKLEHKLGKDELTGPAIKKILDRAGHAVERRATIYSPVDVGILQASWTTKTDASRIPMWTKVGTIVRYARPLEESGYSPRGAGRIPFFEPAVTDSRNDIEKALDEAVKIIEDIWRR